MKKDIITEEEISGGFQKLHDTINSIVPLTEAGWQATKEKARLEFFPKRSVLVKENAVGRKVGFILKGAAKAYSHAGQGKTVITQFCIPYDFCGPVNFILGKPSYTTIEFVRDSWLLINTLTDILDIYAAYKEHKQAYDLMVQYHYLHQAERSKDMQSLTVRERLQKLMKNQPEYFKYFTMGEIASYLGTERETLTRLRIKLNLSN